MPGLALRKLLLIGLLFGCLLPWGPTPRTHAQANTYTTPDGRLQLTLPSGWRVQSAQDDTLLLVNHALQPDGGLTRGLVTARLVLAGALAPEASTPQDVLFGLAAELTAQGATGNLYDTQTIGGREMLRLRMVLNGDYIAGYSFFVDGQLLLFWARTGGRSPTLIEPALNAILSSIRPANSASALPDPNATRTPPTRTPVPTVGANVVDVVGGLRLEVLWTTPLPPLDSAAPPAAQVLSAVRLQGDVVLLSARLQTVELNVATGDVLATSREDTAIETLVGVGPLVTAPEGSLLAVSGDRTRLQRFSADTLAEIGSVPLDAVPPGAVPQSFSSAADGSLALLSVFPGDPTVAALWLLPPDGAARALTVPSTAEGFRAARAVVVAEDDGGALLVDAALRSARYVPGLNTRFEDELDVPTITRSLTYPPAAAYSPERELLVLTPDGLFVYDSLGALLAFAEGTKPDTDPTPFAEGELPPRGALLPLGERELLIFGYTEAAGVAMRVRLMWG